MGRQMQKKRAQKACGAAPHGDRRNADCGYRAPSNPISYQPPHPSARLRQTRASGRRQHNDSISKAGPGRRRSTPAANSTSLRPRTNSAPPHPSISAFGDQDAVTDYISSIPSTCCGRCNSPHLANTHRELKNQSKSLLFGLEKLVAALEALEPDSAEMEWVVDTTTMFYMPSPSSNNTPVASPELPSAASTFAHQNAARAQAQSLFSPPQNGAGTDPAAGAPTKAVAAASAAGERRMPDLNERGPYCPDSCFFEGLWNSASGNANGGSTP